MDRRIKHGHSITGRRTPEYQCWLDMKQRCLNPQSHCYEDYGGRGITVDARWIDGEGGLSGFACFIADMGPRPSGMTVDRIENDQSYGPTNCRWATRAEQISNRRVTRTVVIDGQVLSLTDACSRLGINRKSIANRIDRGIPPQEAIETPVGVPMRTRKRAA